MLLVMLFVWDVGMMREFQSDGEGVVVVILLCFVSLYSQCTEYWINPDLYLFSVSGDSPHNKF